MFVSVKIVYFCVDAAMPSGSSEKETKVPSMEMCAAVSEALRQTFVSMSLEHFSRTNDLRHILAGQHSQSTTPNDDGDWYGIPSCSSIAAVEPTLCNSSPRGTALGVWK